MTLAELRHFHRYRNYSVRQLQSQISPLVLSSGIGTVLAFTDFFCCCSNTLTKRNSSRYKSEPLLTTGYYGNGLKELER